MVSPSQTSICFNLKRFKKHISNKNAQKAVQVVTFVAENAFRDAIMTIFNQFSLPQWDPGQGPTTTVFSCFSVLEPRLVPGDPPQDAPRPPKP